MGAGYCQWGGLTDRNIYNIYGDAHLTSRYHHAKNHVPRSNGCRRTGCDARKDGRKARKYIRISITVQEYNRNNQTW